MTLTEFAHLLDTVLYHAECDLDTDKIALGAIRRRLDNLVAFVSYLVESAESAGV